MRKIAGITAVLLAAIFSCLICPTDIRAGGYFRLVLIDGTVVQGEMIRLTPATVEIDPDGPEKAVSYNRGLIRDMIYLNHKPRGSSRAESAEDSENDRKIAGTLAIKYIIGSDDIPDQEPGLIRDYVMIDGRLYSTGLYHDFRVELPAGIHTLELCSDNIAYYEPTDFYSMDDGRSPRIWGGGNPYTAGKSINIYVRENSTTVIALERRSRDNLFVSLRQSGIFNSNAPSVAGGGEFEMLTLEDGIVPGKLIIGELPKKQVVHDSLEFRYNFVFNQSEWGLFHDGAYLPGRYAIEARTIAWNRWKDKHIEETVSRCELEIRSGHTTIVKFESYIDRLECQVTILPESWLKISTREARE